MYNPPLPLFVRLKYTIKITFCNKKREVFFIVKAKEAQFPSGNCAFQSLVRKTIEKIDGLL